ncbi:hypothetical protein [Maricaulis salignorans]|uniref:Uncharacterized protein n=1 Tax=Maricaulis salignorans TaxID=144026 RepID=A0A1G9SMX9_9PROT|nr:hypothetical protein [Maricaulis salignorans]SDM36782.1 hypothetical protein SAMN04488568_11014 [Maricaulis salignorans]
MWRWFTNNHQTLTGIGAMLVGIAALFVAWDQGRVMRAQQHGAVVPVLQVDGFIQSTETRRHLGLRILNNGVGPAMIRTVSLLRDGNPQDGFAPLAAHFPAAFDRSWSSVNGRALAPGGEVEPVVFTWDRDALSEDELTALLDEWTHWGVSVCYCSVFDRCWISSSSEAARESARACPPGQIDQFERMGASDRPDLPYAETAGEATP